MDSMVWRVMGSTVTFRCKTNSIYTWMLVFSSILICISMNLQWSLEIPGFHAVISVPQSVAWRKQTSDAGKLAPLDGIDSTHRRPRGADTAHAAAGSSCVWL